MAVKQTTVFRVPIDTNREIRVEWDGSSVVTLLISEDQKEVFEVGQLTQFVNDLMSVSDYITSRVAEAESTE